MNKILTANNPIALEICKSLGIDGGLIKNVKFVVNDGSIATVEFTKYITENEGKNFLEVIKKHKLVIGEEL